MGLFRRRGEGSGSSGTPGGGGYEDEPSEGPPGSGRSARGGRAQGGSRGGRVKGVDDVLLEYVREFVTTRKGVEAYVEPATRMASTTVVFVALDGEWTRRAVESGEAAGRLAHAVGIPVYDVNATGYPPAMREWTRRQREAEKARRGETGGMTDGTRRALGLPVREDAGGPSGEPGSAPSAP